MQNHRFKNKVTGVSGSRMGYRLASDLAERGEKVVLNRRDKERLTATEKEFLDKGYSVIAIISAMRFPTQLSRSILT